MTIGELARRMGEHVRVEEAQFNGLARRLDQIVEQLRVANGRTGKLEARVDSHDREIAEVRRLPATDRRAPDVEAMASSIAASVAKAMEGAITIPLNAKTVAAFMAAMAAFAMALFKIGQP